MSKVYAQLDFSSDRYKKVNVIGGKEVGITDELLTTHPANYVELVSGMPVIDVFDWFYDSEELKFISTAELPITTTHVKEPTNAEVAQLISDLQAELIIAGVI